MKPIPIIVEIEPDPVGVPMAIDIIPPRPADRDRRSLIVLGEAQQDVLAALGVERVHDYPGTLAEAGEAIKRHIEKKTGGGA